LAKILNLTQHRATPKQVAAGVWELPAEDKEWVRGLLTFEEPPTRSELRRRARLLALFAEAAGAEKAMIGGAPFFMSTLEKALKEVGVQPVYAFSRREVVEEPQPDGSVKKGAVFRHLGFVEAV